MTEFDDIIEMTVFLTRHCKAKNIQNSKKDEKNVDKQTSSSDEMNEIKRYKIPLNVCKRTKVKINFAQVDFDDIQKSLFFYL